MAEWWFIPLLALLFLWGIAFIAEALHFLGIGVAQFRLRPFLLGFVEVVVLALKMIAAFLLTIVALLLLVSVGPLLGFYGRWVSPIRSARDWFSDWMGVDFG